MLASTTVTTGSLSKPQFITRVNQLCRRGWATILQNFTEYSGWQDSKMSREDVFAKSVRLSFLAGLDFHIFDLIYNMGAPAGEEDAVEEVIGTMQEGVERGQRQVRITSAAQLSALFADYNELARQYGLSDCLVDGARVQQAQV